MNAGRKERIERNKQLVELKNSFRNERVHFLYSPVRSIVRPAELHAPLASLKANKVNSMEQTNKN